MNYIKVGFIVNTFGLKGEVKVLSLTDFIDKRFKKGQRLFIQYDNQYVEVVCQKYRLHKEHVLVQFAGLEDINLIEKYKNSYIYIAKEDIEPLENGKHYFFEIVGCDVYHNEDYIGQVIAVESGFQNILRIKTNNKEILVPYVDAFVKSVDEKNKRIQINVIEGLL